MASNNMYRVGDYVYFETSAVAPYQIRRIQELNKTPTGAVEAKVTCYYRRRDISMVLLQLADKHQSYFFSEDGEGAAPELSENAGHQLRHRELFFSRQMETLPATHIRGKCCVSLLSETESPDHFINKEDIFFYQFVYDPNQKTLLADRGEIRIGSKWQAEIPPMLSSEEMETDRTEETKLASLTWSTSVPSEVVDQMVTLARSVGLLARAYDTSSSTRQPSLLAAASSSARDVTFQRALDCLFMAKGDISEAMSLLLPEGQPLLCRDELEEWSPSEANLFEEALVKYNKDFFNIHKDFLGWKTMKSLVEYYYMWKSTDRHVDNKKAKFAEKEKHLKQVYIPNYTKPNPSVLYNRPETNGRVPTCDCCHSTSSTQWYAWGIHNLVCRLCQSCWTYWKKYGGLKFPGKGAASQHNQRSLRLDEERLSSLGTVTNGVVRSEQGPGGVYRCNQASCNKPFPSKQMLYRHLAEDHDLPLPPNSPGGRLMKATRNTYCLHTPTIYRLARVLCRETVRPRRLARRAGLSTPISIMQIKQDVQSRLSEVTKPELLLRPPQRTPASLSGLLDRLLTKTGGVSQPDSDLLSRERPIKLKAASVLAFPADNELRRKKMEEADNNGEMMNSSMNGDRIHSSQHPIMKKRTFENGPGQEKAVVLPAKRAALEPTLATASVIRESAVVASAMSNGNHNAETPDTAPHS